MTSGTVTDKLALTLQKYQNRMYMRYAQHFAIIQMYTDIHLFLLFLQHCDHKVNDY